MESDEQSMGFKRNGSVSMQMKFKREAQSKSGSKDSDRGRIFKKSESVEKLQSN